MLYWGAFFVTFCILFDWPVDFRETLHLTTWPRKVIGLFLFWSGSVITIQTFCGFWGSFKVAVRFLKSPLSAARILTGFLWDSRKLLNKYRKQFPMRQVFFIGLVAVCTLSLTEENPTLLSILLPAAWLMLIWVLYTCFKWTLNPLPFIEGTRSLDMVVNVRKSAIENLSKVKTTNLNNGREELIKHLDNFKKFITALPKIINFLRGPKLLFTVFSVIFLFSALASLTLISSILRIEHLLTPGGVFSGSFFNNHVQDYFYISLNHFVSAETYNITVVSPNVRYILSLLPVTSLSLTLLLVLAFTMVGQNTVDTTFKNFGGDVLHVIEEATKQISDKREIIVIDQRKEKQSATEPKLTESVAAVSVEAKSASEIV